MPTLSKASIAKQHTYMKCVAAVGPVGATVAKVDNCIYSLTSSYRSPSSHILFSAPSTKLILNGKTPGGYSAALTGKRVKRRLVRQVKAAR